MLKQIPLINDRASADLRVVFLRAKSRGTRAIQAKNPRLKSGKERTRSADENNAKKILLINNGIFSLA